MNATDHPHGGGDGGRHGTAKDPRTPWGQKTLGYKTRRRKDTSKYIVKSRHASTKTRGEVRGGGKKPWKQKGTGRARFGSSRVPIWRGGGITFGPTGNENYSKKITLKAKRKAIRQALSLASEAKKIIVIEDITLQGKTQVVDKLITKIGAKGKILVVVSEIDQNRDRAARNLPRVSVVGATYLNVFDVLNADSIVVTKKSLEIISDWLGGEQ